ncbi:hypothetical protein FOBRF1_005492 [Fusarium oxysporum]
MPMPAKSAQFTMAIEELAFPCIAARGPPLAATYQPSKAEMPRHAIDNHGSFKGPAKDSYDIMTAADSTRAVHHQIGQSLIELGPDGTTASAETYCTATTVNEADGQETSITFLVRYVDQFEKRDGSWKISHRFVAFDAVSDKAIMQYLPKANLGTRDEEDYSRKVLKD